ncbi:MAG TPA: hypothetical protein DCS93_17290 [Microscillaceae bacterium]|nr:hypothetical protein [Microscillaceae bacterium]
MDILKASVEWAKDEVFSSTFFILFGVMFVSASIGFWQLGKTDVAKAFLLPTLVAGVLLLTLGLGLFFTNQSRTKSFPTTYNNDASAFVKAEIGRTEKIMTDYQNIVFKVIPWIIVIAALLIVFIDKPIWRAVGITTIAMMVVILLIDTQANARIEAYYKQLVVAEKDLKN